MFAYFYQVASFCRTPPYRTIWALIEYVSLKGSLHLRECIYFERRA